MQATKRALLPWASIVAVFAASCVSGWPQSSERSVNYVAKRLLATAEAPDSGGASFRSIGAVRVSRGGVIVFTALMSDGRSGIFRWIDGDLTKVALSAEAAPGTGGIFGALLPSAAVNDSGDVVFATWVIGGFSREAVQWIFLFTDGQLTNIGNAGVSGGAPSINNERAVAYHDAGGIRLWSKGETRTLVSRGDAAPGTDGGTFDYFSVPSLNDAGDVAFSAVLRGNAAQGIFLYSRGGLLPVAVAGQPAPATEGLSFSAFSFSGPSDSGAILFSALRLTHVNWAGPNYEVFALYLYSAGEVKPVAVLGHTLGGTEIKRISGAVLAGSGSSTFSVAGSNLFDPKLFLLQDGSVIPVGLRLEDGSPADAQVWSSPLAIDDSGAISLWGRTLPESTFPPELYRAEPSGRLRADDFEAEGIAGMPAGWSTFWSNEGSGSAFRYVVGAGLAFDGESVLRLHVDPGGGAVFVLSDPIPVTGGDTVGLSARMRYNLEGAADSVSFTVVQYDAGGSEIAVSDQFGSPGESRWQWTTKGLLLRLRPETATIRIRFGLSSAAESYLDIDHLQ